MSRTSGRKIAGKVQVMELICPKCQGQMRQHERNGVSVEQCVNCRGIFLDRAELERLVDAEHGWHRSRNAGPATQPLPRISASGPPPQYHAPKKRRSFLEELFD